MTTCRMCHCFGVIGEAVPVDGRPRVEHCFSEDSEAGARLIRIGLHHRPQCGLELQNIVRDDDGPQSCVATLPTCRPPLSLASLRRRVVRQRLLVSDDDRKSQTRPTEPNTASRNQANGLITVTVS